jgi:hypothetical protein
MKTAHDSGNTVTIASKLPNGLVLQLWKFVDVQEQAPNGTRMTKMAQRDGEPIKINGAAVPYMAVPSHTIIGGYALTPGVDRRFWEKWKEQNWDNDALRSGILTAWPTQRDAEAYVKDNEGLKCGLEPLDPDNLPKGLKHPNIKLEKNTKD